MRKTPAIISALIVLLVTGASAQPWRALRSRWMATSANGAICRMRRSTAWAQRGLSLRREL